MRLYGNIQKVDAEQRMVFGYASTEATDGHGEVVLKSAIEDALDDYLEFANIREMHQLSAVGTAEEASVDDKGLWIGAKIVDDTAWGKVTSGIYKGFSIGGKVLARDKDNKKIITKIALNEISLVDRPSNPEARFDVWKAAGLHGGPDVPIDDLAMVTRQRNVLTEQLAKRDEALAVLADRAEAILQSVNGIAKENQRLRQENAALAKRFAAVQPRIVNPEVLKKTLLDLETTILPKLEADTALLRARFEHLERGARLDA
ncbi:HK97 family phage prohead protease [Nitrobacter sp. TKz-YC02]|uniref:HK97 family phage prohead protease n=1 Tax=Nitrobacter sp. TKz-YC02 TaxID=3398704 RepID=UPI003CE99613